MKSFAINTIDGAKDTMITLLGNNKKRILHSLGVAETTKELLEQLDLSEELKNQCMQAAYLHDVGYAEQIAHRNYHPYDGYVYLKETGWLDVVAKPVLFHSYSVLLAEMTGVDLKEEFSKVSMNKDEKLICDLVTIADYHTMSDGTRVSFEDRKADILARHGKTGVNYLHTLEIEADLLNLMKTLGVTVNV